MTKFVCHSERIAPDFHVTYYVPVQEKDAHKVYEELVRRFPDTEVRDERPIDGVRKPVFLT